MALDSFQCIVGRTGNRSFGLGYTRTFLFLCPKFASIITNICLKILCIFVILIIEILLFIFLVKASGLAV